ncbi:MAG: nitroreductase family protein [Bacteroidales bacterium]|nr:nitroreductase family protein [Bacteroidales bacterium]
MADNYLEKRYEEVFGSGAGRREGVRHATPSIDNLIARNRSQRGYVKSRVVALDELEKIIRVCTMIPSARNQQVLRFCPVTRDSGAEVVLENIRLGGALPELHLPLEGTEPEAFIIICSTVEEGRYVDIDLGIAAQSMLLKAVSMGLGGIIICAFNRDALQQAFALPYPPIAVIAIGKGAEKIVLEPIGQQDSHNYYRTPDGVHHVPKVRMEDLLIENIHQPADLEGDGLIG